MTDAPQLRRAWFLTAVVLVLGMAWGLAGLAIHDRDVALRMATAYTAKGEPQETGMDWFQEPPYFAALAVCLAMAVHLRRRPKRLPYWFLLAAGIAFLLWRELPWDERILGANTFSWAKYLRNPDVPVWAQAVFGLGSICAVVLAAAYFIWSGRMLVRLLRERLFAASTAFLVLAAAALAGAQCVDKHRSTDALLGTNLTTWPLKDYLEESLELVGPVMILIACLMAVLEEPASEECGMPGAE